MATTPPFTLAALPILLTQLKNGQLEFDFVGITHNYDDCLYIVSEPQGFAIEFEALTPTQIPWLKKLSQFAQQTGNVPVLTTYHNKPQYANASEAPVLRLASHCSEPQAIHLVQQIMQEVFGNPATTVYTLLP
ncbi:MAG TPA: hypothetical protein PKD90_05835 [Phnomibacter sp.]|nr:hypothetical protein [Phnomibacter sp.]